MCRQSACILPEKSQNLKICLLYANPYNLELYAFPYKHRGLANWHASCNETLYNFKIGQKRMTRQQLRYNARQLAKARSKEETKTTRNWRQFYIAPAPAQPEGTPQ